MNTILEIKPKTIIIAILSFYTIQFLFGIYPVILLILFSYILSCTLEPIVDYLSNHRISRAWSITLVYIAFLLLLVGLIILGASPISSEFKNLQSNVPKYAEETLKLIQSYAPNLISPEQLDDAKASLTSTDSVSAVLGGIKDIFVQVFQFSINTVMVLILSAFLLVEKGKKDLREKTIFEKAIRVSNPRLLRVLSKVEPKLSAWFAGQIFICLLTGIFTYIIFTMLGFHFALPMAIIAALLEAIPNIGPLVAVLIGSIIGFGTSESILLVAIYAISILLFEQFQALYIVPKMMERAVGVNPIIILSSIFVVSNFPNANISIIFLTVPIVAIFQIFLEEYYFPETN